ncbi:hypothetical protein SAMN04489720_1096 [Agrococcus jejuensis]|uniref:Uncharacterized protein n=1 Tax=Agrococcus jejuensis TaxID=399736 RepID=A0A1G8BY85_9MICO|nr:hypothetical protein SAMN04489720_1096 [Agrococcus jejuensis]
MVAALVVIALMWRPWDASGDASADPAPSASTTPSPTPTPTPSPTDAPPYTPIGGIPEEGDGSAACTPEQLLITPITDAVTYAAGQQVQMSFQIQNVSGDPCRLNVGTTQQSYQVRTGDQVVYRSDDCPVDEVDQIVELAPGVPQRTLPVTWDRTASSPETCASPREQVVGGGASYHLSITVSGIASASEQQVILY